MNSISKVSEFIVSILVFLIILIGLLAFAVCVYAYFALTGFYGVLLLVCIGFVCIAGGNRDGK